VRQAKQDAEAVKRLRSCGAVMVGKTNMHELGMGTTGINPHYGYEDLLDLEQIKAPSTVHYYLQIHDAEWFNPLKFLLRI